MWFSPNNDIRKCLSTWSMVHLKVRFETSVTRNDVNGVSLFNLCYLITLLSYTTEIKCPNQVFYVWLVDLKSICAKYGLETCFTPNDDIRKCLLVMMHGSIENACGTSITRNDVNGVSLFYLSYLITLMATCALNGHHMPY
jgi:hypothetical protein